MHGSVEDIRPYVEDFVKYAKSHPLNRFLLTRIGCGIAGFTDEQMARLFYDAGASDLPNIASPEKWIPWYATFAAIDQRPSESEQNTPEVLTNDVLRDLCNEYLYQIGSGIRTDLLRVHIRCVLDNNKFGYANFGQLFSAEISFMYGTGMRFGKMLTIRASWLIPSMMNVKAVVMPIPLSLQVCVPI